MKRTILLSSTFLFACLLGACASDDGVMCEVVWTAADDSELGRANLDYPDLDVAGQGLEQCEEEQATHADRPAATTGYSCDCST